MGWNIDILRPELNKIFREVKHSYRLTRTQGSATDVIIAYHIKDEGVVLANRFMARIAELFPDFTYIEFIAVLATDEVAAQQEWDLEVK